MASRFILAAFRSFDVSTATREDCLAKLDEVCMPIKGTNPSFEFLCEYGMHNENLLEALGKIVGFSWGASDVYAKGAEPNDDPIYSLFTLQVQALFRFRYNMLPS